MNNSKFKGIIPDISLRTSVNPVQKLGLTNSSVEDKAGALLNRYRKYTNVTPGSSDIATQQKLRELVSANQPTDIVNAKYTPGSRIANTSAYNNDAARGQCVWYVRGRAKEKLGVDTGAIGNANQMYVNARAEAKLPASKENIKPNMIVSYNKGTSDAGQSYGHVIYIEDVVGDTVYYTEGGSGYYKNGTDGVVKTATRQGILDGVNTSGGRMGSEVLGFIDLSKY